MVKNRSDAHVVYCLIPRALADELHERLRAHFADEPNIEVIVELRVGDRRLEKRREARPDTKTGAERRGGGPSGRRVRERRRPLLNSTTPSFDGPYASRIVFVERTVPSSVEREDADTAQLIARIQHGDDQLFSEIYLRYFDRSYLFARNFLDTHEAEDATQQAFLHALQALPRYDLTRAPFRIWLLTIMKNHSLNRIHKLARATPVAPELADEQRDEPTDTQQHFRDWITDRTLARQFQRLPESQRQVLVLRYLLDLPHEQIARMLDRQSDDIRALHSRAIRRLRSQMAR